MERVSQKKKHGIMLGIINYKTTMERASEK